MTGPIQCLRDFSNPEADIQVNPTFYPTARKTHPYMEISLKNECIVITFSWPVNHHIAADRPFPLGRVTVEKTNTVIVLTFEMQCKCIIIYLFMSIEYSRGGH